MYQNVFSRHPMLKCDGTQPISCITLKTSDAMSVHKIDSNFSDCWILFWLFIISTKNSVRPYRSSYYSPPTRKCYPTTTKRRNFCLLRFLSEPVRPLLSTWCIRNFFPSTILAQCLDWTLILYKYASNIWSRTQAVRKQSLQVAGLQVHATTLS